MGVLNTAALIILGILLLRKAVLMEPFFETRVYLITAFLCGLLLFLVVLLLANTDLPCAPPPPGESQRFYICHAF